MITQFSSVYVIGYKVFIFSCVEKGQSIGGTEWFFVQNKQRNSVQEILDLQHSGCKAYVHTVLYNEFLK
jgi:hypothetical protein